MKATALIFALALSVSFNSFSQTESLLASNKSSSTNEVKFRDMELPGFIGGQEAMSTFLASQMIYPELALKQGLEGTVFVNFRISKDGKIINPYVSKGVHPNLDKEALRLVSTMPNWIPAQQNGEPREVPYQLPIRFELRN
ncbi:energy transducer TonB [Mongoliitalea daihaiensis]|uniref:energy transducer TonB n=1 Tax=Mongoliitalea daihaiensis TaxID=2782006 RepID=UPI001F3BB94B|nr:energy transducer TonB [Mongoliitalea daihaiensis]UJP65365.1 energy transducer TonB [Mongoliitalea daihaiensis]